MKKGKGVLQKDLKDLNEENGRLRSKLRYERLHDTSLKAVNANRVKNYWKRKAEESASNVTDLTEQLQNYKRAYGEVASALELCEGQKNDWKTKYLAAAADSARLQEENNTLRVKLDANQQQQKIQEMDRELRRLKAQISYLTEEEARYRSWYEAAREISQCRSIYIEHITTQICKAVRKAEEMVDEAEVLRHQCIPTGTFGQRLQDFLDEAKDQYEQIRCFYGFRVI